MRVAVLLVLVTAVLADKYSTKYDNMNIDAVLKNDRLFNSYFNCIMGRGVCAPAGDELKKHLSEGILTDCSKCSAKQKATLEKLFKHLFKNKRQMLLELEAKYDPKATYRNRHQDWLK